MKIFLAFFQPNDDDRDFKRTRRTTESSDHSTGGGSSIVTTSVDRSHKRRADEDRSRGDLVKIPREELSGVRRGDSEPRDDQAPKNRPDSAPFDNVTYPIPSSLHRDRGNRYGQDAQDLRMGMHPHEDSRGRHGSPTRDRRGGRMRNFHDRDRDRYRDDRLRRERRDDRERGMGRKSRCRDYDGMFFFLSESTESALQLA